MVDSRGHPIVNEDQPEAKNADYENLILVGIWLAVKENGETQQNLLKWAQLPQSDDDKTSLLQKEEVENLCENFLEMLF